MDREVGIVMLVDMMNTEGRCSAYTTGEPTDEQTDDYVAASSWLCWRRKMSEDVETEVGRSGRECVWTSGLGKTGPLAGWASRPCKPERVAGPSDG